MSTYKVTWDIALTADTPLDAAKLARTIQQDPCSIATIFEVIELREDDSEKPGTLELVDLLGGDQS